MIYYIIGIRRSGLHAIANWLFPMMGEFIYLNNYELGKLTDIEMVVKGNFNVIIGIENKPLGEILKYCVKGDRIWVQRDIENVIKSQNKWYSNKIEEARVKEKLAESKSLYYQYEDWFKYEGKEYYINYDQWVSHIEYRKLIAQDLGLCFNDSNKETIFGYGKSSYDKKH